MLAAVNEKIGQLKLELKECKDNNQLSIILDNIKKLVEISDLLKKRNA